MKILFVINNFYSKGNGMAASARRTAKCLQAAGHEVRVLSGPNLEEPQPQPDFPLEEYKFPFFQPIIESLGFHYASSDKDMMTKAARWAEVIHLVEPLVLQDKMIKIAESLGKPLTATYHIHPENITCHMGPLYFDKVLNGKILRSWVDLTFNHCAAVQCPTQNVYARLSRYNPKCRLDLFSNGVIPDTCIRPTNPPADYLDPERRLKVLYVGRLSKEKDQFTLIEAMRHSCYARRIQLHFAGQGDAEKSIKRKAFKLYKDGVVAYEPIFSFEDRDGLRKLAAEADLCVHCATIEVEGLSIMEAMQQGAVPVIARGRITGTSQFALDDRSVFPERDAKALAEKIDYWLSEPQQRWETGKLYARQMEQYDIARSVEKLLAMFQYAISVQGGI